jgi:hypothetical protein
MVAEAHGMLRSWTRLLPFIVCAGACSGRSVGPPPAFNDSTDGEDASAGDVQSTADPFAGGDPGAAADPSAESSSSNADGALDEASASSSASSSADDAGDAGPDGGCALPLGPGDLAIDEMMIESVAGAGDFGEWIEVRSNLDCMANLRGLHGECPRGAKVNTFDVTTDLWVPPRGTFVVADSSDPAVNHDLPGLMIVWSGQPGDVLRNKGSTITLSLSGTLLDTVTYPALTLEVGDTVAFPSDCDPSSRSDFTNWKRSTASWFPGFLGTPNRPNADVACSKPVGDP